MINCSKVMSEASLDLQPVRSFTNGLPIYFLTGQKYLYQTIFCITSLVKNSDEHYHFILVDDGSFTSDLIERIHKQLPGSTIILTEEIEKNLSELLPEASYPNLHYKRKVYPHIKKLTDIHTLQGPKWKLVIDSDMLFWDHPVEIEAWLKDPLEPCYMLDCENSYGYSTELMEKLCGCELQKLINVGVIGMNSELINWKDVENWIHKLENAEGQTYYLEQALSAMIIGNTQSTILNSSKYIVNPPLEIIKKQSGTLHHYVDLSKEGYFKLAWKNYTPNR